MPLVLLISLWLSACGSMPPQTGQRQAGQHSWPARPPASAAAEQQASNVVLYALGLVDTGYRFGGKNPAAGFDCSGMVSYIFGQAAGIRISGSAADIAQRSKPVDPQQLRPGDLLFFNTSGKPFSHVGIYIGNGRFVHAPSSAGQARVRTENFSAPYFSRRFEAARSLLD